MGLPLLTVVAMARVGGGLEAITSPIGKKAGMLLGLATYLCIGPMFATPRTATVSFEIGVAPFIGHSALGLLLFTAVYFGLVLLLSLYPSKLMDTVGKLLTPILIAALLLIGGAAFVLPAGALSASAGNYQSVPLAEGFVQGYQTMDALAALVFGLIIVNAIKDNGVTDQRLHTRYTIMAGLIAALGLGLVYISLTYLGGHSMDIAGEVHTGAQVLTAFVQHTFGGAGTWLLAFVILLACLTTGVGLVCACGAYFSQLLSVSYRTMVVLLCAVSLIVANQGLAQLIAVAVPVLYTIYPVAIALVVLSLLSGCWRHQGLVFVPVICVALAFGLLDGLKAAGFAQWTPDGLERLPGAAMGMGWLTPVLAAMVAMALVDRAHARRRIRPPQKRWG